jgi:hypothetical protein
MPSEFQHDVSLRYSEKDKAEVRLLAGRSRQDGLKVWFGRWVLNPGDSFAPLLELAHLLRAPSNGSLAQFRYTNWRPADHQRESCMRVGNP